ncbi:MAG: glycosyltransferase family 1 protein [Bacteroidia bacterium]|nr:glycosyltransferase family 1 protein [Bacteroidia bacterium]
MHIAVNTRLLLPGRTEGISRFAVEVLSRLTVRHPEVRFTYLFDRAFDPGFIFAPNVQPLVIPPPARHPLLWHAWFHVMVPLALERIKPDVFFSPEFYLSLHPRIPQVPVFHDLAYEHYPEDIAPWASRYCRTWSPRYARMAREVLTVSEFSRQDLITRYQLPPERVHVVYNGAGKQFFPDDMASQARTRARWTDGVPYFLFVGVLHPRKNIVNLLRAFDRFRSAHTGAVRLVLAGRLGWQYEEALRTYEAMVWREEVIFTGFVDDETLRQLYGAALALCYLPYFEGFGIPLLEAMQTDTPVICSRGTVLEEVAGGAALLADPGDPEAIAEAMHQVAADPDLRAELVTRGRKRRENFDWEQTTSAVWDVLADVARNPALTK